MRLLFLVAVAAAAPVSAQLSQLSARVEPGAGFVLSSPQRSYYSAGFAGVLSGAWALAAYLDVEAQLSYAVLPATSDNPFASAGSYLTLGAGLRLRRPRLDAVVLPWAEAIAQYVRTGPLDRVGFSGALGALFELGGGVWLGPALRVQTVLRVSDEAQYATRDTVVLGVGLTVEYASGSAPQSPPPLEPAPPPPAPAVVAAAPSPPDTDGDGVVDTADHCPRVVGKPEDDGCPRYTQIIVTPKKIELRQKIFFAFGLPTVMPRSYPLLDEVVQALQDRGTLCVRIEGHTDAVGSRDRNLQLSQQRTDAVRGYLQQKGIETTTLSSRGYGASLPLETNATPEGREQNRRVEFVIVGCDEVGS